MPTGFLCLPWLEKLLESINIGPTLSVSILNYRIHGQMLKRRMKLVFQVTFASFRFANRLETNRVQWKLSSDLYSIRQVNIIQLVVTN